MPHIDGPSAFHVDVVGESNYQPWIERLCGGRGPTSAEKYLEAELILDDENAYDPMAVRVDIKGGTVGFLSRETAREFRRAVGAWRLRGRRFTCKAVIRGGWDRGNGDKGNFGVRLDLPPFPRESSGNYRRDRYRPVGQPIRKKPAASGTVLSIIGFIALCSCCIWYRPNRDANQGQPENQAAVANPVNRQPDQKWKEVQRILKVGSVARVGSIAGEGHIRLMGTEAFLFKWIEAVNEKSERKQLALATDPLNRIIPVQNGATVKVLSLTDTSAKVEVLEGMFAKNVGYCQPSELDPVFDRVPDDAK